MIHPKTELKLINEDIGYGVFAKELIPKGTITWVLDEFDREFTLNQYDKLDQVFKNILETYAYKNSKNNRVLCWDNGRFINHSFNPNCLTTAYNFALAIRDINLGEQLINNYGYLNIDRNFRGNIENSKRKAVYPIDLLKYHKSIDKKLLKAFKYVPKVRQPLIQMMSEEQWLLAIKIGKGEKQMDSILNNYYNKAIT